MDYIIKVAHQAKPNDYRKFCRISEYRGGDDIIDEICNTLNEACFRKCIFIHEDAPQENSVETGTTPNNARDVICACDYCGDSAIKKGYIIRGYSFCPHCSRKLSPVA